MGETYRLNEPLVACEALEGELILIHFESGLYYNVRATGAAVCQHLVAGGSVTSAIQSLAGHYRLPREQVENDVRSFVEQMVREQLLIALETPPNGRPLLVPAGDYENPHCDKFDDMADQLLLDKIDDLAQDAQWAVPPSGPSL